MKIVILISTLDQNINCLSFNYYIPKLLKHFSVYNDKIKKAPKTITQSKSNIELSGSLMRFTKSQFYVIIVFMIKSSYKHKDKQEEVSNVIQRIISNWIIFITKHGHVRLHLKYYRVLVITDIKL